MDLPLYFTLFEKNEEIRSPSEYPLARYASDHADFSDTDLLIATDAAPFDSAEHSADAFCETCRAYRIKGVFFDFEKQVSGCFVRFAELVQKALPDCFYLLPEQYAAISESALILCTPPLPANSWEAFCRHAQRCYGSRWALEVLPYQLSYSHGEKAQLSCPALQQLLKEEGRFLPQAVCMSSRTKTRHLIYDTPQTIRKRLELAHAYGAQLAIGIWQELRYYF